MRTRLVTLIAQAGLVAVIAAGCAGGAPQDAPGTGAPNRAATLSVAEIPAPTTFDPHKSASPNSDPSYLQPVYDQLLRIDENLRIAPMLAESYTVAPDGLSMTLQLRRGVTFSDGTPFDAAAVVANLQRAKTLQGSTAAPLLATVSAVEAPSPFSVKISFSAPNYQFPLTLANNTNLSAMISPAALNSPDLDRKPVGAGPYTLVEANQGGAVYERYEGYREPEAAPVARLEIKSIPDDNARLAALQSGQVQVATARAHQKSLYQGLVDSGEFEAESFRGGLNGILLNPAVQPAFADPRVRKALSLAIDRSAIIQALFSGDAEPGYQPFPVGMAGHVDADENDPYDPEQARRLLAEAGVSNLTFDAILTSTEPSDSIAVVMQEQLARVGVTMQLRKLAPAEARASWRKGGSAAFSSVMNTGADPSVFTETSLLGPDNPGGLPADLKTLATGAMTRPLDDPARTTGFEQLTEALNAAPWHIPVVRVPAVLVYTPGVVGVDKQVLPRLVGGNVGARYLGLSG